MVNLALGDSRAATGALRRASEHRPGDMRVLRHLGTALLEEREFSRALPVYRRLARAGSATPNPHWGLARCFIGLKRFDEAIETIHRGMTAEPDCREGHELLANAYGRKHRFDLEVFHRERLMQLTPGDAFAMELAACAACNAGDVELALRLLDAAESSAGTLSSGPARLQALLHHPESTPETLLKAHRAWAASRSFSVRQFPPRAVNRRKLRIGYLSGEPLWTPSFQFLVPLLRHRDRRRTETFFYYAAHEEEPATRRRPDLADVFRDRRGASDDALTKAIIRDRIDVLVDVSGYYGVPRLAVLQGRAAPVQVSFPNYPATTGVSQIDYILTDRWTAPPGSERQYVEKPYRLDSGYLAWDPPAFAERISKLPALPNGRVTFAMFQRASKLNPAVWETVAAIMRRVPRSHLLIHFGSADIDVPGSPTRARIVAALESRGISPDRLKFVGVRGPARHLQILSQADIALDTFPYNGQTTVFESLWMGVPVVTVAGEAHVARVCSGILHRAGLSDWVASSPEEYIHVAVRKANNLPALAALRASLRRRLKSTSLLDGRRVMREIEAGYRWMWSQWRPHAEQENSCQTTTA